MAFKNLFSRQKRVVASVAIMALATSGLIAISSSADAASKTGGTLYFITQSKQLNHLDPARIYTGQDIAFMNTYVYRSLLSYTPTTGDAGFNLVPDLATDIGKATDGGKTWSWTLKSGIKWQDGSVVTCADEKYGLSRVFATDVITDGPSYLLQDLNIPSDAKGNLMYQGPYKKTGQEYFDKAVTCSGMTITLHLNKAVGDFNYFGTYPAMSPVKQSADNGAKYDSAPWALGPYKVADYKIGTELKLVRNPQYQQSTDTIRTAYPDQIIMRFGISEDIRDQIFLKDSQTNAVDYDQNLQPANKVAFFANKATASRGINVVGPYTGYYALNVSAGHLDCLAARKALFFALNDDALIKLAGGTQFYGTIGDNPISPLVSTDYAPTTGNIHDANFKLTGNPSYAKTLLAQAKTQCPATYSKITTANKGVVWDISNTTTNQKAATLIKTALNAAGIQVTFKFIESGVYYPTVQDATKEDDVASGGWAADWANASTVIPPLFLQHGGFDLNLNWNDPTYKPFAAQVAAAQGETSRTKQAGEWKVLAQFVMDQYWTIAPVFQKEQNFWGSKVGGAAFWMPQGCLLFPSLYVIQ